MIDLPKFKTLVLNELNLNLFAYKEEQLHRRLNSFFSRNAIVDIDDYVKLIKNNSREREKFLDFVTINVTEFYRNPELFKELSDFIEKDKKRNLKIWSAACSNGCEPYSVAILLLELGMNDKFNILATDLDPTIIKKAIEGSYDEIDLKNLPKEIINKYFTKVDQKYIISNVVKKHVTFKTHDLLMDKYEKDFDLVLCRNVVIYFNADAKEKLYTNISKSIKKDGLFFVGATENIHDYLNYDFEKIASFIYKKK